MPTSKVQNTATKHLRGHSRTTKSSGNQLPGLAGTRPPKAEAVRASLRPQAHFLSDVGAAKSPEQHRLPLRRAGSRPGGCPEAQTTLLAIKTWISARDIPGISLKSLHGSEQSPLTVMSIQFVGGHFVVPLQYLFRKHAVTQRGNFIKQHIGFLLMS